MRSNRKCVTEGSKQKIMHNKKDYIINNDGPRAQTAFLVLLVVLSAISIKMAFVHHAELLIAMLAIIPVIIIFYLRKRVDNGNQN
jgi:hypothetical protein